MDTRRAEAQSAGGRTVGADGWPNRQLKPQLQAAEQRSEEGEKAWIH